MVRRRGEVKNRVMMSLLNEDEKSVGNRSAARFGWLLISLCISLWDRTPFVQE